MKLVLSLLIGAILLHAQFEYGEILGVVRDPSGAVVPGAKVTLRNVETNVERVETTNGQGAYSFPGQRAGQYVVQTEQNGFRTTKTEQLTLRTGDHMRIDVQLETGQVNEQVSVSAAATVLETDTSSLGQVVQGTMVRELPLNERDYTQLVLLVPGTTYNPAQRLGGAISVNGNRTLQNNYLLDGVDNNSNATSYRGERADVVRPSVDAIEEFQVLTNAYSAEYGRSAGSVVNVTIKGGTNQFHGAAWEFFRNNAMDAHGWTPTLGGVKPELRFNQYGGNVGGPIRKDRTFFFANYEGERDVQGVIYQAIVPTPDLQSGDFSNVSPQLSAALKVIPNDPTTGAPFPNNMIPKSRWSAPSIRILSYPQFPQPTPTTLIPIAGTYINTVGNTTRSDKGDMRIDQYMSSRWRLFGRYSISDITIFRPAPFKGYAEGSNNDQFGTSPIRGQNAVIGNTITLSPTTILEVRTAYTRMAGQVFPPNFGSPSSTELLGIPNMPSGSNINAGWPKFNIAGLSAFGSTTSQPQFQIPNVYIASGTLSMQRGAHNIRFGFEGQFIQTAILDVSALRGTFNFIQTTPGSTAGLTGNSWADFLIGHPNSYTQTSFVELYNRKWLMAGFLQDDYHILRNLTLNLGVRYEYSTPIVEKNNDLANFNLNTGQLIFAKDGSIYNRALVNADRNNFSPRVGLAWTAAQKLVVRSGYGIFYNLTNRQGREGLLGENPPFIYDLTRVIPGSATPITLDSGPPPNFSQTAKTTDESLRGDDPNLKDGFVQQWNLTLQYELAKSLVFQVGYVGNRGLHLTRFWNANQAALPGGSATLLVRRPYPQYGDIEYMDSGGSSFYNALQTRLEKRFGSGMSFLHSFSYGRGTDNTAAWNDVNGNIYPQNAYDYRSEKGLSANVVKFSSVLSLVYELPVGKGRRFLSSSSRLTQALLGGWETATIWNMRSGLPVSIISTSCSNCQLGGDRAQRADVVPGVSSSLSNPTASEWFNVKAFAAAAGAFGTAARDNIWGPPLRQWDVSFLKSFIFSERRQIQFRGDFFNLFNNVSYNPPDPTVTNSTFGVITSALPGRNIQLALKLYW
jgi:hypothetical protein